MFEPQALIMHLSNSLFQRGDSFETFRNLSKFRYNLYNMHAS